MLGPLSDLDPITNDAAKGPKTEGLTWSLSVHVMEQRGVMDAHGDQSGDQSFFFQSWS